MRAALFQANTGIDPLLGARSLVEAIERAAGDGVGRCGDMAGQRRWETFDHRPRFNNNYIGLRNRFALLSDIQEARPRPLSELELQHADSR